MTDIIRLRDSINTIIIEHYAHLYDSSKTCLQALAREMFSSGVINRELVESPSFDGIMADFISGMNSMTMQSKLEDHCMKFLKACTKQSGSIALAGKALQQELIKVGMTLNI